MKKFNALIRNLTLLTLMMSAAACNQTAELPEKTSKKKSGGDIGGTDEVGLHLLDSTTLRVKNYNQYNMTLQKLTGINRSNHNEIFESIKGSLPADNDISGMSPFNLLAMSRLADAYCFEFVNEKMPSNLFGPGQDERLTDYLIEKFLDRAPEDQPDYYSSLTTELGNIYANDDGSGNKLFPVPNPNAVQASKDFTVAACMTILASPYVTLLE